MPNKNKPKAHASQKASKSFAHTHWRAFEKLSLEIICDRYKEQTGVTSILTSSQNDGGYDGIITFPSKNQNATELYKVLLEAKLRSKNDHALPLSDFSKTIIVAINTVADKVYISTNAYFSEETNRRLQTFSQRTGLSIHTLDMKDIADWLKAHPNHLKKSEDRELLQILRDAPDVPEHRTLSIGNEDSDEIQTEELIGQARKKLCDKLANKMAMQNGSLCIKGAMGSGKSILIDNIVRKLSAYYKNITWLDLTQFSDARSVFIKLLSFSWGETINDIYNMSAKDLADVTEYLGNNRFPKKSREALIRMIHLSQETFEENQNLHSEFLLDYLKKIVPPVVRRIRSLIIVRNVKAATQNALAFLIGFIRILPNLPLSFLIEMEDEQTSCEYLRQNVERTQSYLGTVNLPEWEFDDADQFLCAKHSALSVEDRRRLIEYFGKLPLALSSGADLFCRSEFGKTFLQISSVLSPYNTTSFQYSLGHLDYLIEQFASSGGPEVQCALVLLGLFDGRANIELIEQMAFALHYPSPLAALRMCSFLVCSQNYVRVRHGAYANSIRKLQFVSKPFLSQILTNVEPVLEQYFCDTEYISRKRFEILCRNRDFERLSTLWMDLARRCLHRGEIQQEHYVLKTVYAWWMENPSVNRLILTEQYWLIYHLCSAAYELFGAYESRLQRYLEQLDTLLNLCDENTWPGGPNAFRCAKAEVLNIKAHIALGKAEYLQMRAYAQDGIAQLIEGHSCPNKNLLGMLWANKALAIKHLEGLSACIRFLESGKPLLDGEVSFCRCYYTHLSSLYSVKEPQKALKYFRLINQKYNETLAQYLHTNHNIASMYFALKQYDKALQISGQVWLKAYENHVPIEEGRSDHLLGCIAWVNQDLEQANERFKAAYHLFEQHVHYTHLWPPLINLALLCVEMNRREDALLYAEKAVNFLLNHHLDSIHTLELSTPVLPKLFVGILLLLDCIQEIDSNDPAIDKLLRCGDNAEVQNAYERYVTTHQLNELLENSGYVYEGKRMLKI